MLPVLLGCSADVCMWGRMTAGVEAGGRGSQVDIICGIHRRHELGEGDCCRHSVAILEVA